MKTLFVVTAFLSLALALVSTGAKAAGQSNTQNTAIIYGSSMSFSHAGDAVRGSKVEEVVQLTKADPQFTTIKLCTAGYSGNDIAIVGQYREIGTFAIIVRAGNQ